jgi:hypothetical protein
MTQDTNMLSTGEGINIDIKLYYTLSLLLFSVVKISLQQFS